MTDHFMVPSHIMAVIKCTNTRHLTPHGCNRIHKNNIPLTSLFCPGQFVEKAPEEIVSGVREKAAEAEEKITLTKNRLAFLKSTAVVSK